MEAALLIPRPSKCRGGGGGGGGGGAAWVHVASVVERSQLIGGDNNSKVP